MANIKKLKENGQDIVPITHEQAVLDSNGVTLDSKLNAINNAISRLENNSTSGTPSNPSLGGNTTIITMGNYTIKYNETDDTLDFIYNGATDVPVVPPTTEEVVPLTWIDNRNINISGVEHDDTTSMATDYLTKENGYNYTINLTDVSSVKIYFFDSSKTFISRTDNLTVNSTDILIEFPENTSYFRIKSDKGTATVDNANNYIILKKNKSDVPTTDEEVIPLSWAVGNLDSSGAEIVQENALRSSFAAIVSGSTYSFYLDTSFYDPSGVRVYFYDTNKTYISRTDGNVIGYVSGTDISIDIPSNAAYMRFKANASGTTSVDTIGSLFTLRKRKIYVTAGLSMYINADDVATQGSIRDITGKQSIVNHGVPTTLDNGCLNFVASESDYIDCGFKPNLTQWSAEAYFYYLSQESAGTLLSWGASGNRTTISVWDSFMIAIRDDVQHTITSTAPTSLTHLVLTYNNGTIIAYVNGIKSQLTTSANVMSSQAGNLMIGTKYSASAEFGNIHLKSLKFYDGKVLTDEEALQNYNYEINRG